MCTLSYSRLKLLYSSGNVESTNTVQSSKSGDLSSLIADIGKTKQLLQFYEEVLGIVTDRWHDWQDLHHEVQTAPSTIVDTLLSEKAFFLARSFAELMQLPSAVGLRIEEQFLLHLLRQYECHLERSSFPSQLEKEVRNISVPTGGDTRHVKDSSLESPASSPPLIFSTIRHRLSLLEPFTAAQLAKKLLLGISIPLVFAYATGVRSNTTRLFLIRSALESLAISSNVKTTVSPHGNSVSQHLSDDIVAARDELLMQEIGGFLLSPCQPLTVVRMLLLIPESIRVSFDSLYFTPNLLLESLIMSELTSIVQTILSRFPTLRTSDVAPNSLFLYYARKAIFDSQSPIESEEKSTPSDSSSEEPDASLSRKVHVVPLQVVNFNFCFAYFGRTASKLLDCG